MASLSDYIYLLQSEETYAFSLEEAYAALGKSEEAVQQDIYRATARNEIVNLRRGFYLIIPPRYSAFGRPPLTFYVDKLFEYLDQPYYVAFYTASMRHGASHQAFQQEFVMTDKPLLAIKKATKLRFLTTTNWPAANIVQQKSDAGRFRLSSPALTAIDLIHYQKKLGGLNLMLANIEELTEKITDKDLAALLEWYPHNSTLQRFGFLLEEVNGPEQLIGQLEGFLRQRNLYPVLLQPDSKARPGKADNKWKVSVNLKLESDLW